MFANSYREIKNEKEFSLFPKIKHFSILPSPALNTSKLLITMKKGVYAHRIAKNFKNELKQYRYQKMGMKEIHTEIEILASPESVWAVLTDFASFQYWNPFIRQISGNAQVGAKIEVHLQTSRGKSRVYRPIITRVEPNHELRWLGKSFIPGILSGERIFTIEKNTTNNSVRFLHSEIFKGIGVSIAGDRLERDIRQGFDEMNSALKKRIEQGGTNNNQTSTTV